VVFKLYGYEPIRVMVDNLENEIEIPYTILAESGEFKIGVFGETETQTLPTLYGDFIKIRYGTDTYGTTPPEHQISDIYQLKISKQDKLTAGDGIEIDENNVISATGGSVDLSNYYTKIETLALLSPLDSEIKTTNDSIILFKNEVYDNYYTKTDIDKNFSQLDTSNYITRSECLNEFANFDSRINETNNRFISYYTKTEVDNLVINLNEYIANVETNVSKLWGTVGDIETLLGGI
jgi:hypothetical protein